jgi:hypothetical protein
MKRTTALTHMLLAISAAVVWCDACDAYDAIRSSGSVGELVAAERDVKLAGRPFTLHAVVVCRALGEL